MIVLKKAWDKSLKIREEARNLKKKNNFYRGAKEYAIRKEILRLDQLHLYTYRKIAYDLFGYDVNINWDNGEIFSNKRTVIPLSEVL